MSHARRRDDRVRQARRRARFTKMHASGNDFVVLDLRDHVGEVPPATCSMLADRRRGPGCDLVLAVRAPRSPGSVASFEAWTSTGERSLQCANGARCVAAWLVRHGGTRRRRFLLDSPSGTHLVEVDDDGTVSIDLPPPVFEAPAGLLAPKGDTDTSGRYEVRPRDDGPTLAYTAVWLGNPHAVLEVDEQHDQPVSEIAQVLQRARTFDPQVNVSLVRRVSHHTIRTTIYEYGAGETLSCGTGACAAVAVLARRGSLDTTVEVVQPGGSLHVSWAGADGAMTVVGPTEVVYVGRMSGLPLWP